MPGQNSGNPTIRDGRPFSRLFLGAVGLLVFLSSIAVGSLFFSGALSTSAVQNPSIALDMVTTGNTYTDTTNTMNVGAIDNCLTTAAPGNDNLHAHPAQLLIQNVEDLVGWQVRFNYLGDQMRPNAITFAPFTDTIRGQYISFLNLPIDSSTALHRDLVTATSIPAAAAGPQTAIIGAAYLGAQTFAVSPDTPAKSVPDDSSYSAPGGGVLATVSLQVLAGNSGKPSLFMNMDDNNPNPPGSLIDIFDGVGVVDTPIATNQLGDGYHGEGVTCVPLDCVTQECPSTSSTPTTTPTETPAPTTSGTPTRRTPPVPIPSHPTPPPHPTPRPHP